MIEDDLRAAGVDVDAMRDDARATVKSATPEGWESVMIRSPWPTDRCPSCYSSLDWHTVAIAATVKRLHRAQVLLFSLIFVCERCVRNPVKLGTLAARTFE